MSDDAGIRYRAQRGLLSDGGVIMRAWYRDVVMHLVDGIDANGHWLSIWWMESADEGKGNVQAMIAQLRVEWPGHTLYGSIPISPAAKHIFDKHGIGYPLNDHENVPPRRKGTTDD
jgi:hypothetical protein